MQTIHKDEDERDGSGRTNSMNVVICTERIGRCVKGEYFERSGGGNTRIQISRGIFGSHQGRV